MKLESKFRIILSLLPLLAIGFLFFFPNLIHASGIVPTCGGNGGGNADVSCGWSDLLTLVNHFITYLLYISAAVATFSFSYAGFLYLTSGGSDSQVKQAKGIFIKVLIGFIIVFTAWLLVHTILTEVTLKAGYSLLGS